MITILSVWVSLSLSATSIYSIDLHYIMYTTSSSLGAVLVGREVFECPFAIAFLIVMVWSICNVGAIFLHGTGQSFVILIVLQILESALTL